MKAQIKVGIATEDHVNNEFIRAWKQAAHRTVTAEMEKLYFLDANTLLHVLSNKRLTLLNTLRRLGKTSVRALSKLLDRDYRNVYDDVKLLKKAGLIRQAETKLVYVPWDRIQANIDLAA